MIEGRLTLYDGVPSGLATGTIIRGILISLVTDNGFTAYCTVLASKDDRVECGFEFPWVDSIESSLMDTEAKFWSETFSCKGKVMGTLSQEPGEDTHS